MVLQAKTHGITVSLDWLACDKGTAISGIKEIVEELMKQDKKLTSLKTLQVHFLPSALISAKFFCYWSATAPGSHLAEPLCQRAAHCSPVH